MRRRGLQLIAFDGDDTLWHNERSFRAGRDRFRRLLTSAGVSLTDDEVEERINRTELENLAYYGYGVSSFALSLIETAIGLTDGRVAGAELRELLDLAKQMLTEDIELFPSVNEVLGRLASSYPLMLITKGDLLHQTSKLERSGLRECFRYVEVVSHKTPSTYQAILSRHGVEPRQFLMIGNSLRSDVLPVVEAGGWSVYVPSELSWSHEHAEMPPSSAGRYFELPALDRLPDVIEAIERAQPSSLRPRRPPSRPAAPDAGRRRPAGGSRRS